MFLVFFSIGSRERERAEKRENKNEERFNFALYLHAFSTTLKKVMVKGHLEMVTGVIKNVQTYIRNFVTQIYAAKLLNIFTVHLRREDDFFPRPNAEKRTPSSSRVSKGGIAHNHHPLETVFVLIM